MNTCLEYASARPAGEETIAGLTAIWQHVLGVDEIGPQDDYFDLGGDSVTAVQLFAQIEKTFLVKLPLATLYEATTIEALARLLEDDAKPRRWSSLVPIQTGGWRPPLFLFHGAGGNVLNYHKLAQYLGSDQPVYGLQSKGLNGSAAPPENIEEMAAAYLDEIRQLQPEGPYLLGGYCMGGTLAYEAAQQLERAGQTVALLAMLDTMNWHKVPLTFWNITSHDLQRLWFHAAGFFTLDGAGKRKFLGEKWRVLRDRVPLWAGAARTKLSRARDRELPYSAALAKLWQANDAAAWRYVPRPYNGVVTDVRPSKQYRVFDKPDLKWTHLALGGEQVIVLPVYPAGMLLEPYVEQLAAVLVATRDAAVSRLGAIE